MIVCADDYGLGDDIDRAILELCGAGKLSAVSCMVALDRCSSASLAPLLAYQSKIDVGLHLCFTDEGLPLSSRAAAGNLPGLPDFGTLLRGALLGQVSRGQAAEQVSAQYNLFLQKCGRRPDYVDGHLHAHQLPGIREGLLDFLLSLSPGDRPYVRNTSLPLPALWRRRLPWMKGALIGAFGSKMLRLLRATGLSTNRGFAGIYDFRKWRCYPEYLPRFMDCLPNSNGLLVVHPGHQSEWRRQEFSTLHQFTFLAGGLNRFQRTSERQPA